MKGDLRIGVRVKHSMFGLSTYFKVHTHIELYTFT